MVYTKFMNGKQLKKTKRKKAEITKEEIDYNKYLRKRLRVLRKRLREKSLMLKFDFDYNLS